MLRRCLSIWIPYLLTDWLARHRPHLREIPFVVAAVVQGRQVVRAANPLAAQSGIHVGMVLADAKAFLPALQVVEEKPEWINKLFQSIGYWSIRFAPVVSLDVAHLGLLLDVSGCAHLWGGEEAYLKHIATKFSARGYQVKLGLADTFGAAWAIARFSTQTASIPAGQQVAVLHNMPSQALRIPEAMVQKLYKLGLRRIGQFASMSRAVLRRRFGEQLIQRMAQAFGQEEEWVIPIVPPIPYEERLICMEPVSTASAIEIALSKLLEKICVRLDNEGKGMRKATLKAYRIDGKLEQVSIQTSRPSVIIAHIMKLFVLKIPEIEPALGIELFVLSAERVEDLELMQEEIWNTPSGLSDPAVAELVDRLKNRSADCEVLRYLPDTHHWPERAIRKATSLVEKKEISWAVARPRPARLLPQPIEINVTAPIPDYPPMLFHYLGVLHKIRQADGPERIEREWWIEEGEHRDYYQVEDEQGMRYWLFRSGHYGGAGKAKWFLHGFFA